jgi:Hemopexin
MSKHATSEFSTDVRSVNEMSFMERLMSNISCAIKTLSGNDQIIRAAATAIEINPANAPAMDILAADPFLQLLRSPMPGTAASPIQLLRDPAPSTAIKTRIALLISKYWGARGVRLTVGFLDNPPADLQSRILQNMNAWGQWSNVQFDLTTGNAQVRIARVQDGYWSYLGTDILHIPANQPTMNLQGFTMRTPDSEFHRVVRHETGHTLGFPHEHMRREIIDRIDREKAIAYFMATQGWARTEVINQVLTPLPQSALLATAHADIRSIMCYWLPASIMKDGIAVDGGTDIDSQDVQFASMMYPRSVPSSSVWPNGKVYFFKGLMYMQYDVGADRVDPGFPRPIQGNWPGFPASFAAGVDAATVWNNGKVYFFRGSEYIRYDIATDKTDAGYPRPIKDDWPGLWENDIGA